MSQKIKWGVLGAANIAWGHVLPAMLLCEHVTLHGIASRDRERALQFQERFGFARVYDDYEALLADPEIEAVYNPLPNHLHAPWTIAAAEAGKHVLCEKPLGLNAQEVEKMIAACEQAGVQLAEAFMYRYHPRTRRAKELLDEGAIGDVYQMHASFLINLADNRNIRFDPNMGGGALYDVGCYTVNVSRTLMGAEPRRVVAALRDRRGAGVDDEGEAKLEFGDGRVAQINFSFNSPWRERFEVYGSRATLIVEGAYTARYCSPEIILTDPTDDIDRVGRRVITMPEPNQYALQADHFSRCVLGLEQPLVTTADSLGQARVLDAIFASARSDTPEDVNAG